MGDTDFTIENQEEIKKISTAFVFITVEGKTSRSTKSVAHVRGAHRVLVVSLAVSLCCQLFSETLESYDFRQNSGARGVN